MAKLTSKARQKLSSSQFALPGRGEGKGGKGAGSYPIPDKSHARNALSRVSQHGTPSEKATVRAKVHRKFPDIGKKQFGGVTRMPKALGTTMPKAPALVGMPRAPRAAPLTPRVAGRLSAAAGMKGGGVASFPKPHTYAEGGTVRDRIGTEALTGKRTMLPKFHGGGVVSHSGDPSPASCGSMKEAGGFAALGIKRD